MRRTSSQTSGPSRSRTTCLRWLNTRQNEIGPFSSGPIPGSLRECAQGSHSQEAEWRAHRARKARSTHERYQSWGCPTAELGDRRRWPEESRLRKSEQGDKWSFCLTAGKIGPRIRRDDEQTSTPESFTGLQGEGGAGSHQGRPDDSPTGRAFRRSRQSDYGVEIAA